MMGYWNQGILGEEEKAQGCVLGSLPCHTSPHTTCFPVLLPLKSHHPREKEFVFAGLCASARVWGNSVGRGQGHYWGPCAYSRVKGQGHGPGPRPLPEVEALGQDGVLLHSPDPVEENGSVPAFHCVWGEGKGDHQAWPAGHDGCKSPCSGRGGGGCGLRGAGTGQGGSPVNTDSRTP